MTRTKTALSVIAIVSAALALAGCAVESDAGAASPSPTATPTATAPPATATPTPEPTEASAQRPTVDTISCESMLDPAVDQELRSADLFPFEKPWTQLGFTPTGAAIECPWGVEGSVESATYFAWSALAEGEGEQFLALAAANDYIAREDEQGTWLTYSHPSPQDGSILVTDEWVAIADTPELISAILWTR